jgi:hypothetical protein
VASMLYAVCTPLQTFAQLLIIGQNKNNVQKDFFLLHMQHPIFLKPEFK